MKFKNELWEMIPGYENSKYVGRGYADSQNPEPLYAANDEKKVISGNPSPIAGNTGQSSFKYHLRIKLIDPDGTHVNNSILQRVKNKLELDILNTLAVQGYVRDKVVDEQMARNIEHILSNEMEIGVSIDTSPNVILNREVLDFPVYLLHYHGGFASTADNLLEIINKYGFKNDASYEYAEIVFPDVKENWSKKSGFNGITVPFDKTHFQKICFVKADKISEYPGNPETIMTNLVKHELGHAFGYLDHDPGDVIMNPYSDYGDDKLRYARETIIAAQFNVYKLIKKYFLDPAKALSP